jgi:hypothetical protein
MTMTTYFFGDTAVLTGRTLRHVTRSVDTIITTAITPIAMMLMFVYVFGGAIDTGPVRYIDYMLPGILLITIASGIAYTALRLFTDMTSGIFERFQSMPVARSGVLWAHVLTSLVANLISLVVVVVVALLMGFRSGAGVLAWLAVAGILDARASALVRREPAGDVDRQHDPRPAGAAAGRRRHLDRPRLVRRHPGRGVLLRDGRLPPEDRLRQAWDPCSPSASWRRTPG